MTKNTSRMEFIHSMLLEIDMRDDPFEQFSLWWNDALSANVLMLDAVNLATVDSAHHPDVRVVLLKEFDTRGFVFFTNYESTKAQQINAHSYAALNFFWPHLERQIRIRGTVIKTSIQESQAYFSSRPRGSQIGAWASPQSKPLPDRTLLEQRYAQLEQQFADDDIPCPPNWGGYRLVANYFEFWQGRKNRLHDRFSFDRVGDSWKKERLAP